MDGDGLLLLYVLIVYDLPYVYLFYIISNLYFIFYIKKIRLGESLLVKLENFKLLFVMFLYMG